MKKALQPDNLKSYKEAVDKTASLLDVSPEVVDKIVRRFWNSLIMLTIFGLRKVTISGFGIIKSASWHERMRSKYLKLKRKIYNRHTEESQQRRYKTKNIKRRSLLFTEYHLLFNQNQDHGKTNETE
jgi:hypothetical protein